MTETGIDDIPDVLHAPAMPAGPSSIVQGKTIDARNWGASGIPATELAEGAQQERWTELTAQDAREDIQSSVPREPGEIDDMDSHATFRNS